MKKDLQYLLDRADIHDLITDYGQYVDYGKDTGDWSKWISLFTPVLTADYTSFLGGEPLVIPREQLDPIANSALGRFIRLQHMLVPAKVNFTSATDAHSLVYAEASHYFKQPDNLGTVQDEYRATEEWTIVLRYEFTFKKLEEGWKISTVVGKATYFRGNQRGWELISGG